jgi:dCMP deaminase
MRPSRDRTMLDLALILGERSTCHRRKVGAVAVDKYGRILAAAHNGVARGQPHCSNEGTSDTLCPGAYQSAGTGLDLCKAIHAEQNLLTFLPDPMKVVTVYVTCSPCVHCVKMLMNTSCRRLVFAERYAHDETARKLWVEAGGTWELLGPKADTAVQA